MNQLQQENKREEGVQDDADKWNNFDRKKVGQKNQLGENEVLWG